MPEQLLFLRENHFRHDRFRPGEPVPAQDELFVTDWEEYIADISRKDAYSVLRERFIQFRFPVQAGMSKNPNYQQATRRGTDPAAMPEATGTKLADPANLKVYLYQTFAGRIPVIETSNRGDFETLLCLFFRRNEPAVIPASMGACMIKGYNNWDRIAKYKKRWREKSGNKGNLDMLWQLAFNQMKAQRECYQDTFLILSTAEYSGVSAGMLGISPARWRELSMVIRREHEATHYFTWRFFGAARNHLLDELIADYMGIVTAIGRYKADWFLCFMGLESYPAFRPGGRLHNYLPDSELSAAAFNEVKSIVKKAAENLESFSNRYAQRIYTAEGKQAMLLAMSKMTLTELASGDAQNILLDTGLNAFFSKEVEGNECCFGGGES
ncbi:MAG: hypothetical protein PHU78_09625 [Heliobacteriaceae bacterium]|nr:hypothetical protein [Heliobacteriaceae bacterium]